MHNGIGTHRRHVRRGGTCPSGCACFLFLVTLASKGPLGIVQDQASVQTVWDSNRISRGGLWPSTYNRPTMAHALLQAPRALCKHGRSWGKEVRRGYRDAIKHCHTVQTR